MPIEELEELTAQFIDALSPLRIYLFGSTAEGSNSADSDFDFYIVIKDEAADFADLTSRAYRSIRQIKKRPVDIIVGSENRFENRKDMPSVENEVYTKGILLYGTNTNAPHCRAN